MKGMRKKAIKRILKEHPQYTKNPNTYWRLPNGECISPSGELVFYDKVSETRKGKKQLYQKVVPNPNLTEWEMHMIDQIKKIREGEI